MNTRVRAVLVALLVSACTRDGLDRPALLEPSTCQGCHPDQYRVWSGSMHAYASDDPVFRAMNARGQRETSGTIVGVHAHGAVGSIVRTREPHRGNQDDQLQPHPPSVVPVAPLVPSRTSYTCSSCFASSGQTGVCMIGDASRARWYGATRAQLARIHRHSTRMSSTCSNERAGLAGGTGIALPAVHVK